MYNWFEHYKMTESLFLLSLLVVFILLAILGQRHTWMTTEAIMSIISGIAFVAFPKHILTLETKGVLGQSEIDWGRYFGLMLITTTFLYLLTRETRDGTVPLTIMMSRVFLGSAIIMSQLFVYFGSSAKKTNSKIEWNEQMLIYGILPSIVWMLGNLVHLAKSDDFNNYSQYNIRLNNHLHLDGWSVFMIGLSLLAFPSQIVQYAMSSSNKVTLHIIRSVGAIFLGESIVSLQGPGFLHERDKKNIFLSRILSITMQLVFIVYLCFMELIKLQFVFVASGVLILILVNALIGYCCGGNTIYHVPRRHSDVKKSN